MTNLEHNLASERQDFPPNSRRTNLAKILAWIIWTIVAVAGSIVLFFLALISTAGDRAFTPLFVLVVLAQIAVCIGLSLWLMLRKSYIAGIFVACMLIPFAFAIGLGLEEVQARWIKQ